jgi:hypothetical protein
MGLFAMGRRAFGFSSGLAVKVGNELPGPHKIKACRPGVAIVTAWGIVEAPLKRAFRRRSSAMAQLMLERCSESRYKMSSIDSPVWLYNSLLSDQERLEW